MSALPQNLPVAIDIASLSCSPTVTTLFAGKLIELESLLVLKKKDAGAVWEVFFGKVQAEQCQGRDSRLDVVPQEA